MNQQTARKLLAVILLMTVALDASHSIDQVAPKSQDDVNAFVAQTAKKFMFSRPTVGWKLVPDSDFKKLSITPSKSWALKETQIRYNDGSLRNYPTIVYQGNFEDGNFSNALREIVDKPAVIDCTLGTTFCRLIIQMELLGTYFDTFAREVYNGGSAHDKFVYTLAMSDRLVQKILGLDSPPLGAWFAIHNHPFYQFIHPRGIARLENLFCVGEDLFVGFGSHFDKAKTRQEIFEDLWNAFIEESESPEGQLFQEGTSKEQFMIDIQTIYQRMNRDINGFHIIGFQSLKETLEKLKSSKRITFEKDEPL